MGNKWNWNGIGMEFISEASSSMSAATFTTHRHTTSSMDGMTVRPCEGDAGKFFSF